MQLSIEGRKIKQEGFPQIGLAGDHGAERVIFCLPCRYGEADLSPCGFYLRRRAPSGREGLDPLQKSLAGEDALSLVWEVGQDAAAEAGVLQIQLLALDGRGLLWQSEPAGFTVEPGLAGASPLPQGGDGEAVILLSGRRMLIPDALRRLGVQSDENCRAILFCLPRWCGGQDLSECSFRLRTVSSGGRADVFFPEAEADENRLLLRWTPAPPQTSHAGRLRVQLCAAAEGFSWQSEPGEFTVAPSLDAPPLVPPEESGLERLAASVSADAATVRSIAARLEENAEAAARYAREQGDLAKEAAAGLAVDRSGLFPELTALTMAVTAAGLLSPPAAGQIRVLRLNNPAEARLLAGYRDADGVYV